VLTAQHFARTVLQHEHNVLTAQHFARTVLQHEHDVLTAQHFARTVLQYEHNVLTAQHFARTVLQHEHNVLTAQHFEGFSKQTTTLFFFTAQQPLGGCGFLTVEVSRTHSDTPHSVGPLWTSDQREAETSETST